MKILTVTLIVVFSQLSEAKIADFNTLINEHSKSQNEIHHSIKADVTEEKEENPEEQVKHAEVIVLSSNYEVFKQPKKQKKTVKRSQLKKNQPADVIEAKHFLRIGEELNEAH